MTTQSLPTTRPGCLPTTRLGSPPTITIIGAHKRKDHGRHFLCLVTKVAGDLAAIIFLDDTDLVHIRMDRYESAVEAYNAPQESVDNWGQLLIASGGAFKPIKCFFHLIIYDWKPDGRWHYGSNKKKDDYDVGVPILDGSFIEIGHCAINTAKETLGVWTCPAGDATITLNKWRRRWRRRWRRKRKVGSTRQWKEK